MYLVLTSIHLQPLQPRTYPPTFPVLINVCLSFKDISDRRHSHAVSLPLQQILRYFKSVFTIPNLVPPQVFPHPKCIPQTLIATKHRFNSASLLTAEFQRYRSWTGVAVRLQRRECEGGNWGVVGGVTLGRCRCGGERRGWQS